MKRKTILTIAIVILCFMLMTLAFVVLHRAATEARGYNAIGGEIGVFVLPILALILRDYVKDIINEVKKTEENCENCVEYEYCTFKAPDGSCICNDFRKE